MHKMPDADDEPTPYSLGLVAGKAYCNAAANDDMENNPFPSGPDADAWRDGFNHGIEMWEEEN